MSTENLKKEKYIPTRISIHSRGWSEVEEWIS